MPFKHYSALRIPIGIHSCPNIRIEALREFSSARIVRTRHDPPAKPNFYNPQFYTYFKVQPRIKTQKKGKMMSMLDEFWFFWKPQSSAAANTDLADSFQIFKGVAMITVPLFVLQYYKGLYEAYDMKWQEEAESYRAKPFKETDFSDEPSHQNYDDMRGNLESLQRVAMIRNDCTVV